jgi:hypothetical protein
MVYPEDCGQGSQYTVEGVKTDKMQTFAQQIP